MIHFPSMPIFSLLFMYAKCLFLLLNSPYWSSAPRPDNIMGQNTFYCLYYTLSLSKQNWAIHHTMYLGVSRDPLENKIKQQQQISCALPPRAEPLRAAAPPDNWPGSSFVPNSHQRASRFSLITEQFKESVRQASVQLRGILHICLRRTKGFTHVQTIHSFRIMAQ